jgi:hypothetical protein
MKQEFERIEGTSYAYTSTSDNVHDWQIESTSEEDQND